MLVMRVCLFISALVLVLAACAPERAAATATPVALHTLDPGSQLSNRPVQLMKLESGAECPRAHARQVNANFGPAIGDGPAYAAGFEADGVLNVSFPAATETPFYGSEWSGAKVLWIVAPTYAGPLLIRGGRLDGPGPIGFETGSVPPFELRIEAAPAGSTDWRNQPSYTRLRSPGCYMYQVDGLNFTETIIFEAKAQPYVLTGSIEWVQRSEAQGVYTPCAFVCCVDPTVRKS